MGLSRAGFKVIGIDIKPQPEYPFKFKQEDALKLRISFLRQFDFIWASPPCQAFSTASKFNQVKKKRVYPDLIDKTRKMLLRAGKPFVIENVPLAPIRKDLLLCGEMFGLKVIRHRHFEIEGFICRQPGHIKHRGVCINSNHKKGGYYRNPKGYYYTVTGHDMGAKVYGKALGINWIKKVDTITQCVPPAYSKYIGREFIKWKRKTTG